MYPTQNDIPETARRSIILLLQQRLADSLELMLHSKQAHWNVRGTNFAPLHALFDQVHGELEGFGDLIAERIAQLGGTAEGTSRRIAGRTVLGEYPLLSAQSSDQHVLSMGRSLSAFGHASRESIEIATRLKDAVTADILLEVTRGADRCLWMVEAHRNQGEIATGLAGLKDREKNSDAGRVAS